MAENQERIKIQIFIEKIDWQNPTQSLEEENYAIFLLKLRLSLLLFQEYDDG